MTRPLLVVDHEDASPPGLFGAWLDARGIVWEMPSRGDIPKDPAAWSAIVSLGWEETANAARTEIDAELALLQGAVAADVPVLGLCFGSQLLARALGGTVERRPPGEFGWVRPAGVRDSPVTTMPWFCWHDDAFELPPHAEPLATTDLCTQAYRAGRNVGFQFHPEVDEATIARWLAARAEGDFFPVDFRAIHAECEVLLPELEARAFALFDWWRDLVGPEV